MASTQLLQRRIRTAQNVSKTTRAMQMIAASKLKKAQDAALASRPYVEKLSAITRNLTGKIEPAGIPAYMKPNKAGGKTLVVVISPDKGLCGGLTTNLTREIIKRKNTNIEYVTVGKKAEGAVVYLGQKLLATFRFGNTLPKFDIVYPIVDIIDSMYKEGKIEKVEILSTHFLNVFMQKTVTTPLLPIKADELVEKSEKKTLQSLPLFEPDLETILPDLLKQYIEMVVYQEVLESYLSEQSARMLAMQNATNNAKDIIEDLRLEYNKTRQAKITSEILDITGAAASLNA